MLFGLKRALFPWWKLVKAEGVQSPEMEAIVKALSDDTIWKTIEGFKGKDMSTQEKMIVWLARPIFFFTKLHQIIDMPLLVFFFFFFEFLKLNLHMIFSFYLFCCEREICFPMFILLFFNFYNFCFRKKAI